METRKVLFAKGQGGTGCVSHFLGALKSGGLRVCVELSSLPQVCDQWFSSSFFWLAGVEGPLHFSFPARPSVFGAERVRACLV